jgi:hypothetical protein
MSMSHIQIEAFQIISGGVERICCYSKARYYSKASRGGENLLTAKLTPELQARGGMRGARGPGPRDCTKTNLF